MRNELTMPLGVNTQELSEAQVMMLRRIEEFDLWYVAEKICSGETSMTNITDAIVEFKRYIALVALGYDDLPVPNRVVDEVWHCFILFTREYSAFCESVIGRFIHHSPMTSRSQSMPNNAQALATAYRHVFGESYLPAENLFADLAHCNSGTCRGLATSGELSEILGQTQCSQTSIASH